MFRELLGARASSSPARGGRQSAGAARTTDSAR
jgi:hypothetical protein